MEPLDEKELKELLSQWQAPAAPRSLTRRVLPPPAPWWQWLFKGSIRIPAPVGIAAAVILALWMFFGRRPEPAPVVQTPGSSTLADFQPVEQLEPTIVGGSNDGLKK